MLPQLTLDGSVVEVPTAGSLRPHAVGTVIIEIPFQGHFGAKAVACPTCSAPIGIFCRRPSGWAGRFAHYHLARRELAGKVTLIGLECTRCGVPDGPSSYISPASDEPEFQAVGVGGQPLCRPCTVRLVPESRPSFD